MLIFRINCKFLRIDNWFLGRNNYWELCQKKEFRVGFWVFDAYFLFSRVLRGFWQIIVPTFCVFFSLSRPLLKGHCQEIFDPRFFFFITSVLGPRRNSKFLIYMRGQWHNMHGVCGVIDIERNKEFSNNFEKWKSQAKRLCYAKKLKMHAVSSILHAKYDTACTINVRFERPWQPLNGSFIKNISSRMVLPHHHKNIYI
jgi:hypothetical protein